MFSWGTLQQQQLWWVRGCLVLLFVSASRLKPWGSTSIRWDCSMWSQFPHTCTHCCTYINTSGVWPCHFGSNTSASGISVLEVCCLMKYVSDLVFYVKLLTAWDSKLQYWNPRSWSAAAEMAGMWNSWQTFCFIPNSQARDNKTPVMAMSVASDRVVIQGMNYLAAEACDHPLNGATRGKGCFRNKVTSWQGAQLKFSSIDLVSGHLPQHFASLIFFMIKRWVLLCFMLLSLLLLPSCVGMFSSIHLECVVVLCTIFSSAHWTLLLC